MTHLRYFFAFAALALAYFPHCWAVTVNVPDDHETIQAAITAIEDNPDFDNVIEVARGVYRETLTMTGDDTITIVGEEAAATFLEAENEGEAILSIKDASDVTVRNFTFRNGSLGIDLNNSDVIIGSNIFRLGNNGNAINSDALTNADIINNTFYGNNIAVSRGDEATEIRNNIFDNNNVAISPDTLIGLVSYNCFNDNGDDGVVGISAVSSEDPLFVNISLGDFHLKENSPCIDNGDGTDFIDDTTADMGAYGGDYADEFPFKVQNVAVIDASASENTPSVTISWSANESYRITNSMNPGGYRLHYDSDQPGPPYGENDALFSPIDVGNVTAYTIKDLTRESIDLSVPVINSITVSNQTLNISWSAVPSATGYRLYYGVNDFDGKPIDVGDVTTYGLSGLTNGVTYNIAVSALYQKTYYFSVTAYNNTEDPDHESDYSDEKSLIMGSELSAIMTGIPEAVMPFPLLPDEGCFIATAAFGYYDAPQVQLLRDFRDRYLLNHSPGRWFVKQYYAYGPKAARYINLHPEWKPAVRVALLPLIAVAWVLFEASWFVQTVIGMMGLMMFAALCLWRKKRASAPTIHAREIFS